MLNKEKALAFAREWIDAFNSHDLDRILQHYSEAIEFYSPFIPLLKFNGEGVIRNKTDLRSYFQIGLDSYPDLHFKLHHCFIGVNSVVVYYTSVNENLAAETFILNKEDKADRVFCHYA